MESPISRLVEPSLMPVGVGNAINSISTKFSENEYEKFKLLNGEKNKKNQDSARLLKGAKS